MNRIYEKKWLKLLKSDDVDFQLLISRKTQDYSGWAGSDEKLKSHLIFYLESGIIEGLVNDEEISLQPGDIIWIPPCTRRFFRLGDGMAITKNYRIRFNCKENGSIVKTGLPYMMKSNAWNLLHYFQIMVSLDWKQSHNSEIEKRSLLTALFASMFDLAESTQTKFRKLNSGEMQLIEKEINSMLLGKFDISELAAKLEFSQDYFTRVFKETYGTPPKTYLKRQRLYLAAEYLIDTRLTLKEICYKLNEENISKFCRQFKEVFKCTPTQYRNQK